MECLKVKTFCCRFSLRTGTLVIIVINLGVSFFGLIAWVSTSFMLPKQNHVDQELTWIILLHIGIGILLNMVKLAMSIILYQGLRKEEPKYMLCYLIMGIIIILINIATAILTGIFYAWAALIWVIEIPHQVYFLLVIRSSYEEMVQDRMEHSISPPE